MLSQSALEFLKSCNHEAITIQKEIDGLIKLAKVIYPTGNADKRHMFLTRCNLDKRTFPEQQGLLKLAYDLYPEKEDSPPQKTDKKFYIAAMFNGEGASWSTENFTDSELEVIERFLEELNPHIGNIYIDDIAIIEDEDKT